MIGKYKIIALCTCRIQDKESHNFISALEKMLDKMDCRMIVYNCCSCIRKGKEDTDAKLSVFGLIDPSYVDAVILQADRFSNTAVCKRIIDTTTSMGLPIVVLGEEFENCISITYKHQTGFAQTVSHLIKDHGITDLHMIAGLRNNIYSEERIETFKEVLAENDIPFNDNMISYGDFWPQPAEEAVKILIEEDRLPRGIVCANDNMAIAVVALLNKLGIPVPERVAVTGFDCIDAIYSAEPTITSAYISPEVSAKAVYDAISDIFSDTRSSGVVDLPSAMVANESCGCTSVFKTNATTALSEQHSRFCLFQDENIDLSEIGARIQKCTDFDEVVSIMNKSGLMYSMSCLLKAECVDEKTDLNAMSSDGFGDELFFLYDSDLIEQQRSHGEEFIPRYISASDLNTDLGSYTQNGYSIIISSLYYFDVPMGFVCFHFKEKMFSNYYRIPQIVTALNNALGGMINLRHTKYLIRQIDEMYRNDPLTGLYNRRGFCIEYDKFLENNKGASLSVVMCDLDGLKGINDNFGHEEGDIAIHTVACALRHASGDSAIWTRMGGDEMLAVYVYTKGSDAKFRSEFNDYLDKFNRTSNKNYTVAASVGIYHTRPDEHLSFEELIKSSDALMYSEKKRRKQQLH